MAVNFSISFQITYRVGHSEPLHTTHRCGADSIPILSEECTSAKIAENAANNWVQIPGLLPSIGNSSAGAGNKDWTAEATWAANPQDLESYDNSFHLKWSSDTSECQQCDNDKMRPQCALPRKCMASGIPPVVFGVSGASSLSPSVLNMCLMSIFAFVVCMP
jgi:hypothetical protein